jgi:hypothetical protein
VATAWVIFINTRSTGDLVMRGSRRITGTIIGVVCGLATAGAVADSAPLALGLILVSVFGMFYTPASAYGAVTFFITSMLGLSFTLLHTFSAGILLLRLEETVLGACCGVLAGALVLPIPVHRVSETQLLEVLRALRRMSVTVATGPTGSQLLADARDLDQAVEDFRRSVQPLLHLLNPQRHRRVLARHLLGILKSCVYHTGNYAVVAEQVSTGEAGGWVLPADAAAAADRIRVNVDQLIHATEHGGCRARRPSRSLPVPTIVMLAGGRRLGGLRTSSEQRALHHLHCLDETVGRLGPLLRADMHLCRR